MRGKINFIKKRNQSIADYRPPVFFLLFTGAAPRWVAMVAAGQSRYVDLDLHRRLAPCLA